MTMRYHGAARGSGLDRPTVLAIAGAWRKVRTAVSRKFLMCDDTPFNKLTPAEAERLDLLQEECAEVILAVAKIKRHGYASHNPNIDRHRGNRDDLAKEIGHVQFAVLLLLQNLDVENATISLSYEEKKRSVQKYLHHQ